MRSRGGFRFGQIIWRHSDNQRRVDQYCAIGYVGAGVV